jgi:hypothetical protein
MTVIWLDEQCPVCGVRFQYPEKGYKPKTCNKFDCIQKYNRNPEKYKSFIEHLDECRKKAGI